MVAQRFVVRLRGAIARSLSLVLAIVLCAMVLLETLEVVFRVSSISGLYWAQESGALMLQTLGWLGAARLWLDHEHLSLVLFADRFVRARRLVQHGSDVLIVVGAVWLLPQVVETRAVYEAFTMATLPVSAGVRYLPPLVGIGLLGLGGLLNLLCISSTDVASRRHPQRNIFS